MRTISVIILGCILQVVIFVLCYWLRVTHRGVIFRWDAVTFGGPFVLGAVVYYTALLRSGWLRHENGTARVLPMIALAVTIAGLMWVVGLIISANRWGT